MKENYNYYIIETIEYCTKKPSKYEIGIYLFIIFSLLILISIFTYILFFV